MLPRLYRRGDGDIGLCFEFAVHNALKQGNADVCQRVADALYDGSFMELFYSGWRIVQQFVAADAQVPKEDALPLPHERQVARELQMRRDVALTRVVEILEIQAQPGLLQTSETRVALTSERGATENSIADSMLAPMPRVQSD